MLSSFRRSLVAVTVAALLSAGGVMHAAGSETQTAAEAGAAGTASAAASGLPQVPPGCIRIADEWAEAPAKPIGSSFLDKTFQVKVPAGLPVVLSSNCEGTANIWADDIFKVTVNGTNVWEKDYSNGCNTGIEHDPPKDLTSLTTPGTTNTIRVQAIEGCGGGSGHSRLRIRVAPCTVSGTNASETLVGTEGDDVICGERGDDIIQGLGGNDIIYGEEGDDTIDGGPGNDLIFGDGSDSGTGPGDGDDTIDGGDGHDRILAGESGAGGNVARGGNGDDFIQGGAGFDFFSGGAGKDKLIGGGAGDTLHGEAGNDVLQGGAGTDKLDGGGGNDKLVGGGGKDEHRGGGGSDTILAKDGVKKELVDGGPGQDKAKVDPKDRVRRVELLI